MKKLLSVVFVCSMIFCNTFAVSAAQPYTYFVDGELQENVPEVEMKNGDGSEVQTVTAAELRPKVVMGSFKYATGHDYFFENFLSHSCQIVKQDAYLIMPFDGYGKLSIVDNPAFMVAGADIYFTAKKGDRIDMVPSFYVPYDMRPGAPNTEYMNNIMWQIDRDFRNFAGTTVNDWLYEIRLSEQAPEKDLKTKRWASGEGGQVDSSKYITEHRGVNSMSIVYKVDAPNSDMKVLPYDYSKGYARAVGSNFMIDTAQPGIVNGWWQSPINKAWYYADVENGRLLDILNLNFTENETSEEHYEKLRLYQEKYIGNLVKDNEQGDTEYIVDGYPASRIPHSLYYYTEPQYNIVHPAE